MRIHEIQISNKSNFHHRNISSGFNIDSSNHKTGLQELDDLLDFIIYANYRNAKIDAWNQPNVNAGEGFSEANTVTLRIIGNKNIGTIVYEIGLLDRSASLPGQLVLKNFSYNNVKFAS